MRKRVLWLLAGLVPLYALFQGGVFGRVPLLNLHPRYNLIFVTIDTLRADHTPFGGYDRATMPATAKFFRDGINFAHTETPRSRTTPSYSSTFSGLYPYHHGVRDLFQKLNPDVATIPKTLQLEGYETAGFVSSFVMVGRLNGFQTGFTTYDDYVDEVRPNSLNYERRAERTISRTVNWIKHRNSAKPFFLFIHLVDPHGPYLPPAPFSSSFHSQKLNELRPQLLPYYLFQNGHYDLYDYVDQYDGEILYADTALQKLYEALLPYRENSWIVFLADHGETFSEHDIPLGHGNTVYESETRVPCAWLPPTPLSSRYSSRIVNEPVSLVDIAPTVYDALRIRANQKMDGISLLNSMRGETLPSRAIYTEKYAKKRKIFSARRGDMKLIVWQFNTIRYGLFNVVADPMEQHDLLTSQHAPAELSKDLDRYIHDSESFQTPFTVQPFPMGVQRPGSKRSEYVRSHNEEDDDDDDVQGEDREKLKALGYVN
jgi:choline-sulfatase